MNFSMTYQSADLSEDLGRISAILADLIDDLLATLSRWDRYEGYYMGMLVPQIVAGDSLQGSAVADIAAQLRVQLTASELSQLPQMVASRRAGKTLEIRFDVEYRERKRQERLARKRDEERQERERHKRKQQEELARQREEERRRGERVPSATADPATGGDRLIRAVAAYRGGLHAHDAEDRVAAWLQQFPAASRTAIANELVHVLERSFMSKKLAAKTVRGWLEQPQLVSGGTIGTWRARVDGGLGGSGTSAALRGGIMLLHTDEPPCAMPPDCLPSRGGALIRAS
jgi:hypothetical protein